MERKRVEMEGKRVEIGGERVEARDFEAMGGGGGGNELSEQMNVNR